MVSLLCYLEYLFDRLATAAFAVAGAAALATFAAIATGSAVAVLAGTTVAPFAARATGGLLLDIAFRLGKEGRLP